MLRQKLPYSAAMAALGVGIFALTAAVPQSNSFATPAMSTPVDRGVQLLAQQQQPRTALVIGNANYGDLDSLEGPANDAQAMYEKLQSLGFDVPPPLINATKQEMEQALRDFAQRMDEDGINVFYYSGHGVQIDGVNYLMPVGLAPDSSQVDVQYNAVRLDYVVAQMYSRVHDFNFLIIDACRNNPFYSRWGRPKGPGNQGLTSTRPPRGTVIAYATQENEVAIDGMGEAYSPFTASLLRYLAMPDLNIFEMLTQVAADVATQTNGDQVPSWEGNPKELITLNQLTIQASQPTTAPQPDQPIEQPEDLDIILPPSQPTSQPRELEFTLPEYSPSSQPTLISAVTGVNYQPLQDALAAGDFELAEETTTLLMLRAAGRESEGWLLPEDINNFPCEDLNIIDQLWITNSNGKFGFSVQQQIYKGLGGTTEFDPAIWEQFVEQVGWQQNGNWVLHFLTTFSLDAPSGHLPRTRVGFFRTSFASTSLLGLDSFPSCEEP